MKLRFTPKIIKNLEEKKQHLHLQGSQPRDAPYQLMCLLLVDSPARPTHNKTHAECNNSVKAHDPEAPFHLQRITSELLTVTKASGNSSMFTKCTVILTYKMVLKMNPMKDHIL